MDGLIMSLIVGGVCGWIASLLMKTNAQMGILANIVVGIAGGVLGRWLFGVLGLAAFGVPGQIVMIVVGAAVLIAILKGSEDLQVVAGGPAPPFRKTDQSRASARRSPVLSRMARKGRWCRGRDLNPHGP
jgi:uncharacterized membrane protein YeaQ/YmgE (transglycosylase-associated protein family)